MQFADDMQLLQQYAASRCEESFRTIVTRHLDMVYSVALRHVSHVEEAQEITQAVFIILARKADRLPPGTVLAGWLYQTARLTAANVARREHRRIHREQEAYMCSTVDNSETAAAWEQAAPLLDQAMGRLSQADRNAIVLRFLENKSLG